MQQLVSGIMQNILEKTKSCTTWLSLVLPIFMVALLNFKVHDLSLTHLG